MFILPFKTFVFNGFITRLSIAIFTIASLILSNAYSDETAPQAPLSFSEGSVRTDFSSEPITERLEKLPLEENAAMEYFPFPLEKELELREDEDRFFYQFIKMLGTLGLLIGFMLFASWFLKRLLNTRVQQMNTTSYIKVIERRALSNKSSLYLVEVQGKTFVVGESMQGLSLITNFIKPFSEFEKEQITSDEVNNNVQ